MGISAVVAAVGVGVQAFGAMSASKSAKAQVAASNQIVAGQQQVEQLQLQQQQLESRRKQLEVVRTQQRTRALALSNATAGNAQFGSGLQGGYGQIQGESDVNLQQIGQNRQLTEEQFAATQGINAGKMNYAAASGNLAFASALTSLGGGLVTNSGSFGTIGSNAAAKFGWTVKA